MINIVCLKWGTKYSSEDVNKLFFMVKNNLSIDFKFFCITDDSSQLDSDILPLPIYDNSLEGWWHKLTILRKDLYDLQGTVLFLDLDVVITGSLDEIVSFEAGHVIAATDYGKCKWGQINSSVLRFEVGQLDYVWQAFLLNKDWATQNMHGDQDWLGRLAPQIKQIPNMWVVSFKKHCHSETKNHLGIWHKLIRKGWVKPQGEAIIPTDAKIILFHGKPDPIDVVNSPYGRWRKAPWIASYWKKVL